MGVFLEKVEKEEDYPLPHKQNKWGHKLGYTPPS